MPIKLSGPLTLSDIAAEFGGTKPHDLSDYYRGGGLVPNKNVNSAVPIAGSNLPISYSQFYGTTKIITLSYTAYGGGGAGGSGFENNGSGARGGTGRTTGIMLKTTYDILKAASVTGVPAGVITATNFLLTTAGTRASADGAQGGRSGHFTSANATAGAASDFGDGGAAGPRNTAGGQPAWGNWGSGGGGGGGDQGRGNNYFIIFSEGGGDEWGAAGEGGSAASSSTGSIDLDVEVDYVVRLGAGGYPAVSVGNHDGGYGNPGYLSFIVDTVPGQTYTFAPVGTGTNAERYKEHYKGFRLNRAGVPEFFDV